MIIKEFINAIFIVFYVVGKAIIDFLLKAIELPLTQYGLIKFIAEHDIVFFNSELFTRIIFFIVPFLVTQVLVFLGRKLHIRDLAKSESASIVLYLFFILLASYWLTWVIFIVAIVTCIIYKILTNNVYSD